MGLFSWFSRRGNKGPAVSSTLSESKEGFVDIVFAVTNHGKAPDGAFVLEIASRADEKDVGLSVALGPRWDKGFLGGKITTYEGVVILRRSDASGDAFLQLVDKAYGTNVRPTRMARSARFSAISLEGDPNRPTSGPVKMKLFYEGKTDDEYAEVYFNFDLSAKKAWLREKDPGYRSALIRALMEK